MSDMSVVCPWYVRAMPVQCPCDVPWYVRGMSVVCPVVAGIPNAPLALHLIESTSARLGAFFRMDILGALLPAHSRVLHGGRASIMYLYSIYPPRAQIIFSASSPHVIVKLSRGRFLVIPVVLWSV